MGWVLIRPTVSPYKGDLDADTHAGRTPCDGGRGGGGNVCTPEEPQGLTANRGGFGGSGLGLEQPLPRHLQEELAIHVGLAPSDIFLLSEPPQDAGQAAAF